MTGTENFPASQEFQFTISVLPLPWITKINFLELFSSPDVLFNAPGKASASRNYSQSRACRNRCPVKFTHAPNFAPNG
jgi:hypothetical protein